MSRRDPIPVPNVVSVEHVCRPPRWMVRAVIGMAAVLIATLAVLAFLGAYVYQANQYVQGRGEYRDRENARTNERINDAICDLLDQLPEGGLLNRPREKYGCGPGIPLAQLTPQEQAQIKSRAMPTPAPRPAPLVPLPPAASPDATPPAPGTLPPRTGPGPGGPTPTPPSPDPTPTPLRPVTGLVCDLAGVCTN